MNISTTTGSDTGGLLNYIVSPKDLRMPPGFESTGDVRSNDSPEAWRAVEQEVEPKGQRPRPVGDQNLDEEMSEDPQRPSSSGRWCEGRAEFLASNMTGRSTRELLEEFRALASLRPDVRVNTRHFILSTPEKDRVTADTQALIAERFASLMGLDRRMWVAFRHKDHTHDEIHIVTTNTDVRGALPSDSFIYDRAEGAARQLEEEFGLSRNKDSRATMRRCPTQGEFKRFERTGELGPVMRLQASIDKLLDKRLSFTEFAERLERNGIGLSLLVCEKHVGAVYEFEGRSYRGRRLGRGYTFAGLQREWPDQQERKGIVEYVNERDHAAFSKRASEYAARRPTAAESREQRADRSVTIDERGEHTRERAGEARKARRLPERAAKLARGNGRIAPLGERSQHYSSPAGAAITYDNESRRADQEAAGGRGGGYRANGAPNTGGDDKHLQIGTGRDADRVQEISRADERGHVEGESGDRNVSPAGESVQHDDPGVSETGRAVRGQLSGGGRDDKRSGSDRSQASADGGHRLDESSGRGPADVLGELPLFDAGVPPTGVDDSSSVIERHPLGGGHSRADFRSVTQQLLSPHVHGGREEQIIPLQIPYAGENQRADEPDDKFSAHSGHEHGLTDEPPIPDIGSGDKDMDDFGR
jgi:hypothetical protein